MRVPRSISRLVESFEKLPGIGPKTAQRLTYYLMNVPQNQLDGFAEALGKLKIDTKRCGICLNIGDSDPCDICADATRNHGLVCVVEQPLDALALERAGKFEGVYHVLHGVISPLDHIGPDEIFISELLRRLKTGDVEEVILGLNPTMEGEATAMYIREEIKRMGLNGEVKITRLAQGLPLGGDVEYADEVTLRRAIEGRREF